MKKKIDRRNLLWRFKEIKKFTWPQVAKALDTPLRTVEAWASGTNRIPPAAVKLLTIFLGKSPTRSPKSCPGGGGCSVVPPLYMSEQVNNPPGGYRVLDSPLWGLGGEGLGRIP